jgi:predicted metalloprotease with PDZ domain
MSSSWILGPLLVTALVLPQQQPQETQPRVNPVVVTGTLEQSEQYLLTAPLIRYQVSLATPAVNRWSQVLGLNLSAVDEPLQVHLGLKANEGLLVTGVDEQGVAAKARLQVHDVIVGLPDQAAQPQVLNLVAIRGGQRKKVTLDATPPKRFWIGVNTGELDDALRTQLSLPAGHGILIADVIDMGPAQKAELLKHDVVIGLDNGAAISSTDEFSKAVQASAGKPLHLQIVRHAKSMTLGITPVERPPEEPQQAQATEVARSLTWLYTHNQPTSGYFRLQPQPAENVVWWGGLQAAQNNQAPQDATVKITALQGQVEQLLKEVTALRQAMEKKAAPEGQPKK